MHVHPLHVHVRHYPSWFSCFSRINKPTRMDFPSIFLDDFRGPRKTVFLLKSCAQKVQVMMVWLQVLFS